MKQEQLLARLADALGWHLTKLDERRPDDDRGQRVAEAWKQAWPGNPDPAALIATASYVLDSACDWTSPHRVYIREGDLFDLPDSRWQALLAPGAGWINLEMVLTDDKRLVITVQRGPDQVRAGVEPSINAGIARRLGRIVQNLRQLATELYFGLEQDDVKLDVAALQGGVDSSRPSADDHDVMLMFRHARSQSLGSRPVCSFPAHAE